MIYVEIRRKKYVFFGIDTGFWPPYLCTVKLNLELTKMYIEDDNLKEEILQLARHTLHYTNLLIEQCDRWLSAEEGNRIMEQRIRERRKSNMSRIDFVDIIS